MSDDASRAAHLERARKGGCFVLPRTRILAQGPDAERYLNGQISNAISKASADRLLPAAVLTPKGRLCAVIGVLRAEDGFWIDAERELHEPLLERLDRYLIADEVELLDHSRDAAVLHAYGDQIDRMESPVIRSQRIGCDGVDHFLSESEAASLLAAVSPDREPDAELIEILRIERGIPRWGAELTGETLPAEAGLERTTVDFEKGCYVGQETVSRLESVGQTRRLLCGLVGADGGTRLEAGWTLRTPGGSSGEKPLGQITSAIWHFGLSKPVGLAYVRRGSEVPGTRLDVIDRDGQVAGSVEVREFPLV